MPSSRNSFSQFMKEREEASRAFVNGEVAPLDRISTQVSPATIFGPMGNCLEGAKAVNAANAMGAKSFQPGGSTSFEVMQTTADDRLAFWSGIQRAKVKMAGKKGSIPMDLRVTEVFRRERGKWKLIHRHADALKAAGPGKR